MTRSDPRRKVRTGTHLYFLICFSAGLFLIHLPYLSLPYFWDEMGQFVPAALDILHDGAWVPHSTVPNVHPPGVMAYLALVWRVFGYSIPATRSAMLLLSALVVLFSFLLAIQLCRGLRAAPAFTAILLLLCDPLFYTQSMMAQLDMPAMLFTVMALLLFLQDRHIAAALACTALVASKETGALLPLIFGAVLFFDKDRRRYTALYIAPFVVLAGWLFVLWRSTGQLFGDAGFAHYNIGYALHPVRAAICLVRRIYYLLFDDFRWVGSIGMVLAWQYRKLYANRAWRITGLFITAHVVMVSVLGGAELERYLLPILPLLYIAMAAAWTTLLPVWRNLSIGVACAGLIAGMFRNPPFPFPYENNLAMADFVQLQQSAAQNLEESFAGKPVYTAWPLTQALRNPAFGYVRRPLTSMETSDLRYSTLRRMDPDAVDVLVLYSRTWEPEWSVLRLPLARRFLAHFYEYEPQMDSAQVREHFGLQAIARWTQRGQWIEIYARR
jgi:4-amino-4-deoxy-L-arabinose transferase-like glycosyltransferase